MRQFCCLIIAIALCPLTSQAQQRGTTRPVEGLRENAPTAYVLQGGRIVVRPGTVIDNGTLVIRNGRITSVRGAENWPPDHRLLDMAGKTIYAGLIDGYREEAITISELPAHAVYWNVNVRPERNVASLFEWDEPGIEDLHRNGFTAALVAPREGIFRGRAALVLVTGEHPESSVIRPDVAQAAQLTVERRFGGPRIYPSSPMGAVALARQALYDAIWYQQAWAVARQQPDVNRPEINESLAVLGSVVSGETPLVVRTSNELMVLRADRFAREFDANLVIVGNGNEYRRLTEITALNRPLIVPLNFPDPPNVKTVEDAIDVTLESLLHWDLAPENPARLSRAGVEFAITTQGLDDADEFLKRLRQAVARGLDRDAALAALTTVPAKIWRAADQLGTIETGKLANLVVTDGDLFEKDTKVLETWVAGQQHRIEDVPLRKVAGKWQLTATTTSNTSGPPVISTEEFELIVTGSGPKYKGTWRSLGKQVGGVAEAADAGQQPVAETLELQDLKLAGSRLSGSVRLAEDAATGMAQFSVLIDPDNQTGTGMLFTPDGLGHQLSATALELGEIESVDSEPDDEDVAGKKPMGGGRGGRGGGDEIADSVRYSIQPALFEPNYPLGNYGRLQPPAEETVLFQSVTLWTCGPDGVLENASVLVSGGKIQAIYPAGAELPAVQNIVDGTGCHLTPGIIDCHSHMATDSGVNEGSQAITAEVRIGDFIDCDDVTIFRQLAGGVTASNILHGSANPIGGQNQVIKLRWGALGEAMKMQTAPAGIKFALGENVKRSGSRRNPDVTPRYPATRMGVEQLMHDTFRAAQEYQRQQASWNQTRQGLPPRPDLELNAIVEILEGKRWIHCHSYRQDEILALIRVLDQYNVTIGTFQHILEGYKVAEKMAEHGAMASAFSDWWAYKFEVYDAIPYAGALMHDAGLVVSFNSDDGELATHLNQEAAKAVKYGGVPPAEALKFVTLNPARQLRIDSQTGSIETGKDADMVLWNGPPLSSYSSVLQTWIDGRKYFDVDEARKAESTGQEMYSRLVQKILDSGESVRNDDSRNDDPQNMWPRYDEFCGSHIHGSTDQSVLSQLQQAWEAEEQK